VKRAFAAALLVALASPPGGWFGTDKLKHFMMSFLVHSSAYSTTRAFRVGPQRAQAVGIASAVSIGVLKEIRDKRAGKPFSIGDLVWDGAGTASSAALLNRSR